MTKEEQRWHLEENFHDQDRKASRKERKRCSQKDRSKFKKSDQDQLKKKTESQVQLSQEHLKIGRVIAIVKEGIIVSCEKQELICQLKGSLKQEKNRAKNLVAVGDCVQLEEREHNQGSIIHILPRHSILSRADNLSRNKEQLIAVNIDQVFITTSVVLPPLKPFLIDRYIIAAEKGNMTPIILINKIDLFENPPPLTDPGFLEEEKTLYDTFLTTYRKLGIQVFPISVKTGEGIEAITEAMRNKTSVFSGQSGVGKSSLINLITGTELTTGEMVHSTRKGSHTTTTTHLVPLANGGFCIDTPGIKSFGLWDLSIKDLASYFSEIHKYSEYCKYLDCQHHHEPECAVKKAVEDGDISPLRFASYSVLITSLSQKHKQR